VAWRGIYVDPEGKVDNCCISSNRLGDLNSSSIGDVIQGNKIMEIRQSMINGQVPRGCDVCYNSEANNLRQAFLNRFRSFDKEIYDSDAAFQLNYLDLRWRNTCNSACVYCGPELSSKIAAEQGIEIRSESSTIERTKQFIDQHLNEVKYIYLAGGEPLLIRENEWLLSLLLDRQIYPEILVNTNLSQIDNRIFELLCKFPKVRWLISGEHVGEHYEYIRFGSVWQRFSNNLDRLVSLTSAKGHSYEFNMVYFALNLQGFWQYLDWIKSKNIPSSEVKSAWISNGNPDAFDPRRMPERYRSQALDEINQRIENGDDLDRLLAQRLLECWKEPVENSEQIWSWRTKLTSLDESRNLNSKKLWPEIWAIFDDLTKHWDENESR
jgi:sulfatase maturation enzyme AslB (radical SAM superfamily)